MAGELTQVFGDVGFADLDFDGDALAVVLGEQVDDAVAGDGVFARDAVAAGL